MESEASVNKQINFELNAHYQYLALVRNDIQSFQIIAPISIQLTY